MKNVLITGASEGIGRCIALELLAGYNVFGVARNEKRLKELNIKDFCAADLSKPSDLMRVQEFINKNKIDILINNAGMYVYSGISEIEGTQIDEIFALNSVAPAKLISYVTPNMIENNWGRIVNIGSISGVMGEAYASMYSATKASLIGMSKALALELAASNITVNTINPGWVDTNLGRDSISDSEFSEEEIIACVPQKRFVEPKEIAELVKYLISDSAKGITGQSINLCAGLSVGF